MLQHVHYAQPWSALEREFFTADGVNIAQAATTRHINAGRGGHSALCWINREGEVKRWSYTELDVASARFAGLLQRLGVQPGERVFTLLGRVPELTITLLGSLRYGAVYSPLFSAFGPEPLVTRLQLGQAQVLVTTWSLYQSKLAELRDQLPALRYVLLIDGNTPDTLNFTQELNRSATLGAHPTQADDWALLHFTSGTTGKPKGAQHVHAALLAHVSSAQTALDLRPQDTYWCTADPGWVTGIVYGQLAPLLIGATVILDEAEFDARRWYRILSEQRVNVWYTAPTAIRMLMRAGAELAKSYDLSALRLAASVGEPLHAEAVIWGQQHLGQAFRDTWWQTETGSIMVANYPAFEVRPGSMGQPLPGLEVAVVNRDPQDQLTHLPANRVGQLAIRANWPSLMRGYLGDPERYAHSIINGWYLSGDLVRRDEHGYLWFIGRDDDVIKTAGHLIGPFEVESVLLTHPAVSEAAVIGKPDLIAGEIIKAFIVLRPGYNAEPSLSRELLALARKRLGAAVAPREIEFRDHLPHNRSGKTVRRLLRARELGLPEGDTSTLEPG